MLFFLLQKLSGTFKHREIIFAVKTKLILLTNLSLFAIRIVTDRFVVLANYFFPCGCDRKASLAPESIPGSALVSSDDRVIKGDAFAPDIYRDYRALPDVGWLLKVVEQLAANVRRNLFSLFLSLSRYLPPLFFYLFLYRGHIFIYSPSCAITNGYGV